MEEEKSFLDYMLEEHKKTKAQKIWWWITVIFWHRSIGKIPDFFREIKWAFQRAFRSHHSSDRDIWDLHSHLSPILLGKLKAFRASPLHGYPSVFSDWSEEYGCMNLTKEEYDKEKAEGKILGGGFDAWLETLDKMIFAFDFYSNYDCYGKEREDFLKRYNLEEPHAKKPENRKVHYAYRTKEGHFMSSHLPPDKEEHGATFLGEEISYYNFDLEHEYYKRAHEGIDLFAKHYLSLWD